MFEAAIHWSRNCTNCHARGSLSGLTIDIEASLPLSRKLLVAEVREGKSMFHRSQHQLVWPGLRLEVFRSGKLSISWHRRQFLHEPRYGLHIPSSSAFGNMVTRERQTIQVQHRLQSISADTLSYSGSPEKCIVLKALSFGRLHGNSPCENLWLGLPSSKLHDGNLFLYSVIGQWWCFENIMLCWGHRWWCFQNITVASEKNGVGKCNDMLQGVSCLNISMCFWEPFQMVY